MSSLVPWGQGRRKARAWTGSHTWGIGGVLLYALIRVAPPIPATLRYLLLRQQVDVWGEGAAQVCIMIPFESRFPGSRI